MEITNVQEKVCTMMSGHCEKWDQDDRYKSDKQTSDKGGPGDNAALGDA